MCKFFQNSALLLQFYNFGRVRVSAVNRNFINLIIMSSSASSSLLERVESNFKKTDYILSDINQKLADIASLRNCQNIAGAGDGNQGAERDEEYDKLKEEIEKWKELLTIREIRNGRKFVRYHTTKTGETSDSSVKIPASDIEKTTENDKNSAKSDEVKPDNNESVKSEPAKVNTKKEAKTKGPKDKAAVVNTQQSSLGDEIMDVSRLDFRIGKIVQVEKHPDADSLYLETVDVGEPNPRTVVSGLVKHVPIEEMQNRMVVMLCNLKPAKMRGVTSEAMVMCASTPEKVEILIPPAGAVPGDLVDFEGFARNPDPVLNPKKKIFETLAPDLKTDCNKVATYKTIPFTVKGKGVVTTATLASVNIK